MLERRAMRWSCHTLLLLAAILTATLSAQTTERVAIDPKPTCPGCKIELRRVVTIPAQENFMPRTVEAIDSAGRWFVQGMASGTTTVGPIGPNGRTIAVYDKAGRFLKVLGGQGRGPGEFEDPSSVAIGAGDTSYISDYALGRISVFSPSLKFVRVILAHRATQIIARTNGDWLLSDMRYLALLDHATAKPVRTFTPPPSRAACPISWYAILRSGPGRFWAASDKSFDMTEFDLTGHQLREVVQEDPPWIKPCQKFPHAPQTYVKPFWYDAQHEHLWIETDAPVPDFQERARAYLADKQYHGPLLDVHVEVIDLRARAVLVSQRVTYPGADISTTPLPFLRVMDEDSGDLTILRPVIVGAKK